MRSPSLWFSANFVSSFQRQLSDSFGVASDQILGDASLSQLDENSLDAVEIALALGEELDISFPDNVVGEFKTVGNVIHYIEVQLRNRGDQQFRF